jgi:hypothetical protein
MWVLFWRTIHKVLAGEGDKPVFFSFVLSKEKQIFVFSSGNQIRSCHVNFRDR